VVGGRWCDKTKLTIEGEAVHSSARLLCLNPLFKGYTVTQSTRPRLAILVNMKHKTSLGRWECASCMTANNSHKKKKGSKLIKKEKKKERKKGEDSMDRRPNSQP
jgi:hypothetical protein